MNQRSKINHRSQLILVGIGSLLNDIASEMIYPLLPLFLTVTLNAPVAIVGLILGIAEACANFSKLFFGWLSDKTGKRKCFIVSGYALSAIDKVLMGLSTHWFSVLVARSADRFGKGMRTPARDAFIVENTTHNHQARAFGFHRTLDSIGAVIGPLIGLMLLWEFNNQLRPIFFLTFIPSVLCILLVITFVHDPQHTQTPSTSFSWAWVKNNTTFMHFLVISCIFGLAQSSDLFFILRSYSLGLTLQASVLAYVSYQLFQTIFSFPAGIIADRVGARTILILGYLLFALISCAWALMPEQYLIWILFPLYGVYMALTDGMSKAYIARIVPHDHLASAFGLHQALMGTCALFASWIAGILWTTVSSSAPFVFSTILALCAVVLFFVKPRLTQS